MSLKFQYNDFELQAEIIIISDNSFLTIHSFIC